MPTTPPSRGTPVNNRVRGGRPSPRWYMRVPETRSRKDGRWRTSTLRDGVSLKTPRGRQWQTTSVNFAKKTVKKTNINALSGDAWSRRSPGLFFESTAQEEEEEEEIIQKSQYIHLMKSKFTVAMRRVKLVDKGIHVN